MRRDEPLDPLTQRLGHPIEESERDIALPCFDLRQIALRDIGHIRQPTAVKTFPFTFGAHARADLPGQCGDRILAGVVESLFRLVHGLSSVGFNMIATFFT